MNAMDWSKKEQLTSVFRQKASSSGPASKTRSAASKKRKADSPPPAPAPDAALRGEGEHAVTDTDISPDERVLRSFDLATKYGPCVGMTRLERWERAQRFGLNPPEAVRDTLMRLGGTGSDADNCIWYKRV